jgi:N-methylhydantoinase A
LVFRLGVDVGGTFTDLLLVNEETSETHRAKTPSTPSDPSIAVLSGMEKICNGAGIQPADIARVMHGTTVATNVVLEEKGARVGLVVSEGYDQILQVARSFVPGGLAGWIVWPKPEPLVDLRDTVEAVERVDTFGELVRPLDEDDLRAKLEHLKDRGIEALTVSLMNAYASDVHEKRVAEVAAEVMPSTPISLSSSVLPVIREYERTLSTVVNAYVGPAVSNYLRNLDAEVRSRGVKGDLLVLRSDGGLASVEAALEAPVNLLLSGPAGGVTGALSMARTAGFQSLLTIDMGGTSTDVSLIENGEPRISRTTHVGDLEVRSSSIDVRTVGAGGGSIAHVPELTRALRVGPQSAGADPGPAAYGQGGNDATVTDANVVLGYLPGSLLGGEVPLDVDAARAAVQSVANALGLSVEAAASGIVDIVNEAMYGALRLVSVQQGYDPRDFALVAFGGAGPLHANALGRLLGSWPVIIPPSPGVLNAYGDATTRLRNESSRTFIRLFSETSADELRRLFNDLRDSAAKALDDFGVPRGEQSVSYQVDMRYEGQGFEVTIPVDPDDLGLRGLDAVGDAFDAEHERQFTFNLQAEHELVNARAVVQGGEAVPPAAEIPDGGQDSSKARDRTSSVWVEAEAQEAWIYDRARLRAGNRIEGPAIVTEMDATTLVLPGHVAEVDRFGNLLIEPGRT